MSQSCMKSEEECGRDEFATAGLFDALHAAGREQGAAG